MNSRSFAWLVATPSLPPSSRYFEHDARNAPALKRIVFRRGDAYQRAIKARHPCHEGKSR